MNIGIIGSGEMGTSLASRFTRLGHKISIANSRGPASIEEMSNKMGTNAVAVEDAVKNEVIVISIPQKNIPDLPKHLFQSLPAEVVVIDTGNYYPILRDGVIPSLEKTGIDSLWVQQQLGVPVVKAFNAIFASSLNDLGRPPGDSERIAVPISGDSTNAKQIVIKLLDELGFDAFDVGGIAQSWKHQTGSSVYCRDLNFAELKARIDDMGKNWSDMHKTIITRRRDDEIIMKVAFLKGLRTRN
jgi:predicted dinucleotide-binding enzyme